MLDSGMDVARLNFSHGDHKVIISESLRNKYRPMVKLLIISKKLLSKDQTKLVLLCWIPRVQKSEQEC